MRPCQAQASADTSEGAAPAASQSVATEQRPEVSASPNPTLEAAQTHMQTLLNAVPCLQQ